MNQRKSLRLKDYDYSENGAYFITICTKGRNLTFTDYPELKTILTEEWNLLSRRFSTVITDAFVVMPNHVHGIIFLIKENENVGATLEVARRAGSSSAPTVGRIIGVFKSVYVRKWVTYLALADRKLEKSFWQYLRCQYHVERSRTPILG
jgi:putative transposase